MCSKFEMKFNHGLKSVDFKLSGFSEENSIALVNQILKTITESGNKTPERKIILSPKGMESLKKRKSEQTQLHNEVETDTNVVDFVNSNNAETDSLQENPPKIELSPFDLINEKFQAYYVCTCGDRGKRQIKRSEIYLNCHKCGKRMRVRDAHIEGFPMKDQYGNTFIAGTYKRIDEIKYGAMVY